ncbi:glycerophosphodiester phosphodiesterase [bacterium]|nr:glycerophosphodiester phosphodiesterase [bacterium]
MYDRKLPLIFAHRGASADAPMNTLAAFELAVQQGADGIELDVHRSIDGVAIVLHDFEVTHDRWQRAVSGMTLAQVKALDAGQWFGEQFTGLRVPTLDDVFDAVGQKLFVNVEIKSRTAETDGVEQTVADCIARHGMGERVLVSSFNPLALHRFREIAPDVPVAVLDASAIPEALREMMRDFPHEAVHPHQDQVTAELVGEARCAGRRVNVWTVNDADRARELAALGVDALITDVPGVLRAALA